MARLLLKALRKAGFAPEIASRLRTHDKQGDGDFQERVRQESFAEAERLIAHYRSLTASRRPALWFTYHVYYKAPDWIGPRVADALGIPYAIAEGSRATKRADGPWALGHVGAERALDRANLIFGMTANDRSGLQLARPANQSLIDLPPFLDEAEWHAPLARAPQIDEIPRLLTVAMMRPGDKYESYRILSQALAQQRHLSWSLDIVGDGEARRDVVALFAPLASRVRFHGIGESRVLQAFYESADIFVWPAVNEAYGMVLLEAQLFGIPVIAGNFGGVGSVVKNGETGFLTPPGDIDAFAKNVSALIEDPTNRRRMGEAARAFVVGERNLSQAATRLHDAILPLIKGGAA
jgi:glycosyltransferase involved in cell wall biosynthesis